DGPQEDDRHHHCQGGDARRVDGRLPRHCSIPDDPGSCRLGRDTEAAAAVVLAVPPATTAAAHLGGGDHQDPVTLDRVAVDPLDVHHVAGAGQHLVNIHAYLLRVGVQSTAPFPALLGR